MTKNLKQKGNQFFKQGEFHMAINMYKKYVAKPHDDNKNAYYNMGLCMFKTQKYEECINACKQAIKIDENYLKSYYRLALASQKLENQYQTLFYARQFCERSKSESSSNEFKQMKSLQQKYQEIVMFPSPAPIEQRLNIFYTQQSNNQSKNSKKDGENTQYFKGFCWLDVQKSIDQEKMNQALNKAYGICRSSQNKNKQINQQNLRIVKKIKSGALPKDTKIVTDQTYLQKKPKKNNLKQLKHIEDNIDTLGTSKDQTKQKQNNKEQFNQLSLEDQFKKHFLQPLQKKLDIFQGFPNVLVSIISNKSLKSQRIQQILQKIQKQYGMFSVLQLSMSQSQKDELRKHINIRKLSQKFIKSYCC